KFNQVLDNSKLTKQDRERFGDQSLPSEFGSISAEGSETPLLPSSTSRYGEKNRIFTRALLERSRLSLRKKLNPNRLGGGIDPTALPDLLAIAGYHLEAGAVEFADWSSRMVNDVGDWVLPILPDLYHRTLESIYCRSLRPGLDRNEAESLGPIVGTARSLSPESLQDPGVDSDEDAAGLGSTTSTYSDWPTHLTGAETDELMRRPDMKITDAKGAGAARPHRHHLFSQIRRDWFFARGIHIDGYTIEM